MCIRDSPISVAVEAIPTPAPFLQRPLDQLAPGLARYRRSSEDDVIAAVSWLQGPDSDTLPILLETDSDSGYPVLQGFIQLVPRDDSWRLGLNFWANTHGHYLPEIFEMPGPPASPQRIAVLAPAVRPNLETRRGTDSSEQQDTVGGFLWTGFEGVLHAGVNVVIDNQCFQAPQRGASGLHLAYHVDAVAVLGHHFSHGPDLALYARQAGICFLLRLVSHSVIS